MKLFNINYFQKLRESLSNREEKCERFYKWLGVIVKYFFKEHLSVRKLNVSYCSGACVYIFVCMCVYLPSMDNLILWSIIYLWLYVERRVFFMSFIIYLFQLFALSFKVFISRANKNSVYIFHSFVGHVYCREVTSSFIHGC